jgi:hypothetical protein
MGRPSVAMVAIVLAVILMLAISGFFGFIKDAEKQTRVHLDDEDEMMKLIMYDSMIAYGCNVGGWLDIDGDKFWGSWSDMKEWGSDPTTPLSFQDLNESMPRKFKNLPCYGTGSTLPGTGSWQQNFGPWSKEWRDDQEGRDSRIKFRVNDTFRMPMCFFHRTYPEVEGGVASDQYEKAGDGEVSNSQFFITDNQHRTVFKKAHGANLGGTYSCESVTGSHSGVDKLTGAGINMNVNVIATSAGSYSGVGATHDGTFKGHDIEMKSYEFPEGTVGYVQTNTGCSERSPPYFPDDKPGLSYKETGADHCDNRLHPMIVVTRWGN